MHRSRAALSVLLFACALPVLAQDASPPAERTFAIRSNGRVVGYQIETETPDRDGDRDVVRFTARSLVKMEILGQSFEQRVDQEWTLDARSRRTLAMSSRLLAGDQEVVVNGQRTEAGFEIEGGDTLDPEATVISPEFRWLADRGPQAVGDTVEVDCLVPEAGGGAMRMRVEFVAEPEVDCLGQKVRGREYQLTIDGAGTAFSIVVDASTFEVLRSRVPAAGLTIERAAPQVVERIERIDLTDTILGKVDFDYDDPSKLTLVRVRAVIEATDVVTREALDAPGQRFEGTVEDGVVDGVFEIRARRIDGSGSPPFPPPAGTFAAEELRPYLLAEANIESDHPGIREQARELADGATTCFEVLDRLSRWTGEIPYVIPGGGSAARTFELRAGECGGHSRVLAAMLRSLGIPARTPMGGMYVPIYGGCFAQHMWTEAWLGDEIGWLPVDCTAGQWTYVDAGHIRLSEHLTRFQPRSLEVLAHEPAQTVGASERRSDAFPWPVGTPETFVYRRRGELLGEERMVYRGRQDDGGHLFETTVELLGGRFVETATTVVGDDGRLIRFDATRKTGGAETRFRAALAGDQATVRIGNGDEDRESVVDVPADVFVMHSNNMTHVAIVLARLQLTAGQTDRLEVLQIEQRSTLPLAIELTDGERPGGDAAASVARAVELHLVGIEIALTIDDEGRLLTYGQGDVTITRKG